MTRFLLDALDEAFDKRSWHGTNLRGSIRGLTLEAAVWRPASIEASAGVAPAKVAASSAPAKTPSVRRAEHHNIWELVVHAAYWKYAVRRRLTGAKRGSFPLEGTNFWIRPIGANGRNAGRKFSSSSAGTAAQWKRDVALLVSQHRTLQEAVAEFPRTRWSRRAPGSPLTHAALVRGVAAHDLYHAGQIQLLKRLHET